MINKSNSLAHLVGILKSTFVPNLYATCKAVEPTTRRTMPLEAALSSWNCEIRSYPEGTNRNLDYLDSDIMNNISYKWQLLFQQNEVSPFLVEETSKKAGLKKLL